jgi:CxxC motif-containing protein
MNTLNNEKVPEKIICVACPKGCRLDVLRENGEILVNNAGCKRGKEYAIGEVTDPRRMVASTVRVRNALHPLLPVYTSAPFPKGKILELLAAIREVELSAPVKMDQVVIENALGTGINIIASRDLK